MTMGRYDVVVVGARVAGASTALLLARAGLRVALVDRSAYGSDTLSTLALMRAGVLQLSRWGVLDDVTRAGTPAVRRTLFHHAGDETVSVSIRPTPGVDALYAPRRRVLDRILVDAATAAGVNVLHGVTVTGLLEDQDQRVSGIRARRRDGHSFELHARVTVGADGLRSVVANAAGASVVRSAGESSGVLYRYFADLPVAGYEWGYGDRAVAGLVPTNDGLTCVFVAAASERVRELRRAGAGAGAAFDSLFAAAAPAHVERLAAAVPHGRLHGWAGVPGFVRRAGGPGWALVGDAGYFKDPITAHGITDALRDAELLTGALVDALSGTTPEALALSSYQATRDRLSAQLFEATDRIAAYDWDAPGIRRLLRQVSAAMSDEVELLQKLPDRVHDKGFHDFVLADIATAAR
jgi:flavin-dependent dehydrogenase